VIFAALFQFEHYCSYALLKKIASAALRASYGLLLLLLLQMLGKYQKK
jgi:hypothetical protein